MADSDNVRIHADGNILVAPVGTTAPTATGTSWAAGFVDLGYISEDGVEETSEDDWQEIRAWQNGEIVRRFNASSSLMFSFTVIETTAAAVGLFYPGSTLVGTGADDGPATLTIGGPESDRRAFGIDYIDGTQLVRTVIPIGEVTEKQPIVNNSNEAIGYGLTITAYAGVNGVRALRYYSALPGIAAP